MRKQSFLFVALVHLAALAFAKPAIAENSLSIWDEAFPNPMRTGNQAPAFLDGIAYEVQTGVLTTAVAGALRARSPSLAQLRDELIADLAFRSANNRYPTFLDLSLRRQQVEKEIAPLRARLEEINKLTGPDSAAHIYHAHHAAEVRALEQKLLNPTQELAALNRRVAALETEYGTFLGEEVNRLRTGKNLSSAEQVALRNLRLRRIGNNMALGSGAYMIVDGVLRWNAAMNGRDAGIIPAINLVSTAVKRLGASTEPSAGTDRNAQAAR